MAVSAVGEMQDVLVIGGGISGLATAWHLQGHGLEVTLWERGPCAGGKIRSLRRHGWLTEAGATWLMDPAGDPTHVIESLGLGPLLLQKQPDAARYLLRDGMLRRVPVSVARALGSGLFSTTGQIRMALEPFMPRRDQLGETVADFVRRRFGGEVLRYGIEPYVAASLASDPERAEARTTLPRLTGLETRYGSIAAGIVCQRLARRGRRSIGTAVSFQGGMQSLAESLAATVRPQLGRSATVISRSTEGWQAQAADGTVVQARHLVLTTPAPAAAQLLASVDPELAGLLAGIRYAPVMVAHLGYDRGDVEHALDGTGFLVPGCEGRSINGCLWPAGVLPGRAPSGHVLLSCYLGGARQPQALVDCDTTVIDKVATDLSSLLGLRADPTMTRVDRHPQGLPLYFGAYSQRLEAIHQRLRGAPGLHLCGAYSGGVSVRDRLAQGAVLAERIADEAHSAAARYRSVRGSNANQHDKHFVAQVSGSGLS